MYAIINVKKDTEKTQINREDENSNLNTNKQILELKGRYTN